MRLIKKFLQLMILLVIPSIIAGDTLCREIIAESVPKSVAISIRNIIVKQIEAFKSNDPETAFLLASPGIREQFGTAENFMEMVKEDYSVILLHSNFEFRELQKQDNIGFIQTVFFEKKSGKAILALYFMELQPNGEWRINGCKLVSTAGVVT